MGGGGYCHHTVFFASVEIHLLMWIVYLECAVVSLQLPAQALQLAAGKDGLAVFVPQVVLLLDNLALLLLKDPHMLLGGPVLFQLSSITILYWTLLISE